MSDTKKIAFTTGEIFNLTGSNYVGYYNVLSGVAYVGKYTQDVMLKNTNTIQNTITLSDKFFNRLNTENITLTYTLSDFVFEPNEFINTNSINLKLLKAYNNFLDTYRACFFASSKLPYGYNSVSKLSATSAGYIPVWSYNNTNSYLSAFSAYSPQLTRSNKLLFIKNNYSSDADNYTLIVAGSGTLFTFLINPVLSTFNVTFSSSRIETNNLQGYNEVIFNNITSIAKGLNTLYVCDAGNKAIYSYDISGVVNEDRALSTKFNLTNTITTKEGDFVSPLIVASSYNNIFVYDNTGIIYYYDKNFNVINNYKNGKFFKNSPAVSFTYRRLTDELYVLTNDYQLIILDSQVNSTFYQFDTSQFAFNEVPLKLVFSNTNSDIFYLLTNRGIYKKFVSNNFSNIGVFTIIPTITGSVNSYYAGPDPYTYYYDMDTYDSNENFDNLLVYGYDQFINFREQTLFNSILK